MQTPGVLVADPELVPAPRPARRAARSDQQRRPGVRAEVLEWVRAAAAALLDSHPEVETDAHGWRDAAVRAVARRRWQVGDLAGARALADGYQELTLLVPVATTRARHPRQVMLVAAGTGERRARGAFATPGALADVLAVRALPQPDAAPTIVDPACGTGALLRAAVRRLLSAGVDPAVVAVRIHGVDTDPAALEVARTVLAAELAEAGASCTPQDLATRLVLGDALLGPTPRDEQTRRDERIGRDEQTSQTGAAAEPEDDTHPGPLAWHRVFPAVLAVPGPLPEPVTGWSGGFGAVLANPPWERLKVTARDWTGDPPAALRGARARQAQAVRVSGRHPLTGIGELNAYLPFVETCWRLLAPGGRAALVVPAGMATDRSAAGLIEALVEAGSLDRLHVLDPPRALFAGVSDRVGVALVDLQGGPPRLPSGPSPVRAEVAVGVSDPAQPVAERAWRLERSTLRLVNPNTATLPLFGSQEDARITIAVYRRRPVLLRRDQDGAVLDDPWGLRLVTPLHMTRDAKHFRTAPGPGLLPLWEAKHARLLDHRGGIRAAGGSGPRYWVPAEVVQARYGDLCDRGWLAGYRNVTTVSSPRTLLPCALPVLGVGNSLPLLSARRLPLLLAALASLPVDYVVRQKHAGANLNFFKLEQVALPPPEAYDVPAPWQPEVTIGSWVLRRFARAVAWHPGLDGLAAELAGLGIEVPQQRLRDREDALADLDAAHAVLLGLDRADLVHVLDTFPALRAREEREFGRFATARRVLAAYDALNA